VTFGILARIHCEMAVPRLSKYQAQSPSTTRTFIAKLQHSIIIHSIPFFSYSYEGPHCLCITQVITCPLVEDILSHYFLPTQHSHLAMVRRVPALSRRQFVPPYWSPDLSISYLPQFRFSGNEQNMFFLDTLYEAQGDECGRHKNILT